MGNIEENALIICYCLTSVGNAVNNLLCRWPVYLPLELIFVEQSRSLGQGLETVLYSKVFKLEIRDNVVSQ